LSQVTVDEVEGTLRLIFMTGECSENGSLAGNVELSTTSKSRKLQFVV